jgi:hypothetical protein
MPTNVRDVKVIWRCEECVKNKGQTGCSYARWVEGFDHKETEGDTAVWRVDNTNVGRQVEKRFGTKIYKGIITNWMPGTKQEWELWKVKYEDGDEEDLDTHELLGILQKETKKRAATESQRQPRKKKATETDKASEPRKITRRGTDNTKRNQKKKRRTDAQQHSTEDNKGKCQRSGTRSHDTLTNGQAAGKIRATNKTVTSFLAQIKGETLGTLEDGQCLRRALGKLWNIPPGQVIGKLAEGSEHVVRHKGKLKLESRAEWYNTVQNRPPHWYNIKHNVRENCSRDEWGGQNELKLWAYITQTTIIVMHKVQGQITIYTPDPHTLPEMKPVCDLATLHAKFIQEECISAYLMYNGTHYNPIVHDNMQLKPLSDHMPEWEAPPPPKRKRTCQGELASATNEHKSNDSNEQSTEPERKRTKTMITTEKKLQKRRNARDNECDLDAQEYKSRKKKKEDRQPEE